MSDAALRSLAAALVDGASMPMDEQTLDLARRHRIDRLIPLADARVDRRLAVAAALSSEHEIRAICDGAHRGGIALVLIKGAALAYTHYAAPHLRPRDDIDVLVRREELDRVALMLTSLGYEREPDGDGELWTGQRHYVKTTPSGVARVDVHWRAANPRAFSQSLPFEDVWARVVPIPALGPHARTLSPPDALLLACLHRVAHHRDRIELLWLWDIHLLASCLQDRELEIFRSSAVQAGTALICARGLRLAHEYFRTVVPAGLLADLEAPSDEPSAAFLGAAMRPFDVARADLEALATWRERAGLLREHLFPPAAYMRQRFPRWPAVLLPLAYVHRIVQGAPRWMRR